MAYLLKTEPDVYSFGDLLRDGETIWDGVANPQAVKFLREMRIKDQLVIYHTGDERTAVGTATVVSVDASDPKSPLVCIRCGKLIAPKTLPDIKLEATKAKKLFANSPLLRQGRLSVVPLTEAEYAWLTKA